MNVGDPTPAQQPQQGRSWFTYIPRWDSSRVDSSRVYSALDELGRTTPRTADAVLDNPNHLSSVGRLFVMALAFWAGWKFYEVVKRK